MTKAELIVNNETKEVLAQPRQIRIGIEGPMGSGKSTFMSELQNYWPKAKFTDEVFIESPYLAKYYDNPKEYAFHSQVYQLGMKANLLKDIDINQLSVFVSLINDKSYAETLLSEDDLNTYLLLYNLFIGQKVVPQPDVLLMLVITDNALVQRVKDRDRVFERDVDPAFLGKLNQTMFKNSMESGIPVISVDAQYQDFRNPERMAKIVGGIEDGILKKLRDKFRDPSSGLIRPAFAEGKEIL